MQHNDNTARYSNSKRQQLFTVLSESSKILLHLPPPFHYQSKGRSALCDYTVAGWVQPLCATLVPIFVITAFHTGLEKAIIEGNDDLIFCVPK